MTTIPELFERVAGKVPEVRPKAGFGDNDSVLELGYSRRIGEWCLRYSDKQGDGGPLPLVFANMLIEAACWRLLPGYWWEDQKLNSPGNRYVVHNSENSVASRGASITEALLLAVEQVHGGK